MKIFRQIRVRVTFFVVALLLATTLAFYVITARIVEERLLDEIVTRSETFSESLAAVAGNDLLSKDLLGLDTIVDKIKKINPDIRYIAIADNAMMIIVHSDTSQNGGTVPAASERIFRKSPSGTVVYEVPGSGGGILEMRSPVVFMNKKFGTVILGIDKSVLLKTQRDAGRSVLAVFAIVLFLGILGSFVLSSRITRPIKELSSGVEELKEGGGNRTLTVYAQDELGLLIRNFNEMSALIREQRDRIGSHARELEEAYLATVKVLAAAIDARDHYTHGHSTRVAQTSLNIARKLGFGKDELDHLEVACLFHDVGKLKIPDAILQKQDQLDAAESRVMKRHPEYGAEILGHAVFLGKYVATVRHHHEWYDGSGYPDGLKGDLIPLSAAIISLADSYDAMTSDRPYRRALRDTEAKNELAKYSGRQFRPELVSIFLAFEEPC